MFAYMYLCYHLYVMFLVIMNSFNSNSRKFKFYVTYYKVQGCYYYN